MNIFQLKKSVIDPLGLPNSRQTASKVLVTVSSSYTLIALMGHNYIQPSDVTIIGLNLLRIDELGNWCLIDLNFLDLNFLGYILTSTLLGKTISAIYVNKSPNQLQCYSGPAFIYLQNLNSLYTTR